MKPTQTATRSRLPRRATSLTVLLPLATCLAVLGLAAPARGQGPAPKASGGPPPTDAVPYQVRDVTIEQKLGERVPLNLPLTDSEGRRVKTGYFIDGKKPTILTFNYSDCPMLCSVQLNQLTQSLAKMDLQVGQDFQLLSVSINPRESTEQVRATKNKYVAQLAATQPGAEAGWAFCTAKQPIITALTDKLGFSYRYDRSTGEYYHPAMLAFLSPEGVITRYSLGVDFPPDQMRKALVESGNGTVGTQVDQFVLWCFSYDAESNSYVPQAWKIMRLGGGLTVVIVLACLAPYWIGRKRFPASPAEQSDATPAADGSAGG